MTEPIAPDICERITSIVISISPNPLKKISADEDLFASGSLDSVALIGLVTKIEDEFQIKVSPTEYSPENFMTISGLSGMVSKLITEKALNP